MFAELELDFDILNLAQRLIGEAPPTAELHHYLLAHLLDPTEKEFARVIMLGAANAKIIDPIRFLLPEFGNQLGDLFFTQLLKTAERVGFTLPMDVLAQIADFLREPETLAGLAVGTAISRGLTDDVANEHKSMHELMAGKRIRNLLHEKLRGPSPIPPQPSTPVDPNLFGRLYHRLWDCKREMRAQNEDRIPLKRGSAEVSWLNFMLERGPTTIEPKSFFSNARKIDGALTAASHSANEALQWGPYVTLQPGCYTVTFLGEMEAHLTAVFEITAAYGEQLLARNVEIASGEGKHEVLAHLSVCLETKVEACEFVIYPRTRAGLIISRGVRIEWRPLSGSSPDFSK
ncbi:hypothetical protein MSC49_40500 (plasmid) [Methylosinus sp. C49]|nr:hypothetical protein MSC49_40500 [Methylosinus sp. C49]